MALRVSSARIGIIGAMVLLEASRERAGVEDYFREALRIATHQLRGC